jgi:superfamily II DNA or RNA helicase
MRFEVTDPSHAYIKNANDDDMNFLHKSLSYKNTSNAHLMKRHSQNQWLRTKNPEQWRRELERLKGEIDKSLVFEDSKGFYIRPGSVSYLSGEFEVENLIRYPTPKKVPWAKPLPFELHEYQKDSISKLIGTKHGNVELCTGAGKSAILLSVCRETGFKTTVVAPSRSIFYELLDKFETHLGKGNIGVFGAGRKKIGKRFTLAISDSLVNVKPGTPEWEFFSNMELICVDESHTWGADTLEQICHNIFAKVPYRFFTSGTQTRGDGGEKLLHSIIGKTVHKLSTKDAVAGGFICPHNFTIVSLESSNPNFTHKDSIVMKRAHFLNNKNIAAFIAKLANADAMLNGRQTLVLVDELSQISMLTQMLKVPYVYAHSDSNNSKLMGLGITKVDSDESVEKFNKNEAKVLIGTSCIATGTNIFPCHNTINWVGGTSEIRTKQGAVGRSVRLLSQSPWADRCATKSACRIFDFDISDVYIMQKHLEARLEYYQDSGSEIRHIKL